MTLHKSPHTLLCHLCGYRQPVTSVCTDCGGQMIAVGSGTQRIEEALIPLFKRYYQGLRALRVDSDFTKAYPLEAFRSEIESGHINLLIGTQMIAKGYNFPRLACLGVLGIDAGLLRNDFRAEERLFATLSQVIGRSTRYHQPCSIVIQTAYPNHPLCRELVAGDVHACWQRLLAERQHALLPPFSYLALIRGKDKSAHALEQFMFRLSAEARKNAPADVRVFDPIPPPVERMDGWHHRQLLLLAKSRQALQSFLTCWVPTILAPCRFTVEVDPTFV